MSSSSKAATLGFLPILLIAIIFGTYLGLTLAPASTGGTSQSQALCSDASHALCISYLSVRENSSDQFYPTLWSQIYVPQPTADVSASIDGVQVYYLSTSQEKGLQDISQQIRNSSLRIVAGREYSVTFTVTYASGEVGTLSRTVTALLPSPSNITATGVSLCSQNCVYPAPHLSALVSVNASVPLSRLQVFVNGSLAGDGDYAIGIMYAQHSIDFKGGGGNQTISAGSLCNVTFVGTFEDGTVSTSTSLVRAMQGSS
ncbi:MAG TPA: hypothetical protein VFF30_14635 [Nitrososphaerales archaeon]|nr:hypothetical protein [Nitrososphaerales archaeon]